MSHPKLPVDGQPIVSSSLATICLGRLEINDEIESQKLLQACMTQGFFYLDLRSAPQFLATWKKLLDVMLVYFNQPSDIKMQDRRNSDFQGYEPMGTVAGLDLKEADAYEAIKIPRRELCNSSVQLTTKIKERSDLFLKYTNETQRICMIILQHLSDALGLQGSERFEQYHRDELSSLSILGLMKYPKHEETMSNGTGHHHHTDIGTLSFLLSEQWGLQIVDPKTKNWAYVEPRDGHAVINVGDSLRFTSGFKLASAIHRVKPVMEKQHEDRFTVGYFLRMEDGISFTDGIQAWSAKEWHDHKYHTFRNPFESPDGIRTLNGGMESDNKLFVSS